MKRHQIYSGKVTELATMMKPACCWFLYWWASSTRRLLDDMKLHLQTTKKNPEKNFLKHKLQSQSHSHSAVIKGWETFESNLQVNNTPMAFIMFLEVFRTVCFHISRTYLMTQLTNHPIGRFPTLLSYTNKTIVTQHSGQILKKSIQKTTNVLTFNLRNAKQS